MSDSTERDTREPDATAEGLRWLCETLGPPSDEWFFDVDPDGGPFGEIYWVGPRGGERVLRTKKHPTVAAAVAEMVTLVKRHLDAEQTEQERTR